MMVKYELHPYNNLGVSQRKRHRMALGFQLSPEERQKMLLGLQVKPFMVQKLAWVAKVASIVNNCV